MSSDRYLLPDDPNYPAKRRLWIRDPVDGGKILREETKDVLFDWCDNHCVGRFRVGMGFIDFELDEDYVMATMVHA
jgi:hypothetical protein